jgi:hypothetical protein
MGVGSIARSAHQDEREIGSGPFGAKIELSRTNPSFGQATWIFWWLRAVDPTLMCQRFLTEITRSSQAAHISRQDVPQRSFVSPFHKADVGSLTLLRRPLLSYIRSRYLQIADAPAS